MHANSTRPSEEDEKFQKHILNGVSRTFALTIPELPSELSRVVSNAYLLCRIADTIEDDKDMTHEQKREYSDLFIDVVSGDKSAAEFAKKLAPLLSDSASVDEKTLIENSETVIKITYSLNSRQHEALKRCIRIMADGMATFQENSVQHGLLTQQDMDDYCYHVAGVVGEMLTELFCDYSDEINQNYDELMSLAVSFGQGLQMTNILKDIWDDRARKMCWLPQDVFNQYGSDLNDLLQEHISPQSRQAVGHLIGITRSHLDNALRYSSLIPAHETGIRHFCLWALGMAVLTLRNINRHRDFTSGQQVKISRLNVKFVILLVNMLTRHDKMLRWLFDIYVKDLPHQPLKPSFNTAD